MSQEHPNIEVLKRFDPRDPIVLSEDVVFHFFNPLLPDLHGDHIGREGVIAFFAKLQLITGSTFEPHVVSIQAIGDELVVVHRKQAISLDDRKIESDVVVVWRIVNGQIKEVWDIPSVHNVHYVTE